MKAKKKIGISFTKTNFENYVNWFSPSDLSDDLEIVKLSFMDNNIDEINQCDAFVLTGGVDVDPSYYGGPEIYTNCPAKFQKDRDQFEEKIYRYAQQNQLPLLAICRGLQLVNVLEGGKLIQDLGIEENNKHKKGSADKIHEIEIMDGSLMHQITSTTSGMVNSAHHQSIDPNHIGENLMVSAKDSHGTIIEAIEFKDKTNKAFMLCVQYHPERMEKKEQNPLSQKIKENFLTAVRNN
jgi:putative glutamine amidotransferase